MHRIAKLDRFGRQLAALLVANTLVSSTLLANPFESNDASGRAEDIRSQVDDLTDVQLGDTAGLTEFERNNAVIKNTEATLNNPRASEIARSEARRAHKAATIARALAIQESLSHRNAFAAARALEVTDSEARVVREFLAFLEEMTAASARNEVSIQKPQLTALRAQLIAKRTHRAREAKKQNATSGEARGETLRRLDAEITKLEEAVEVVGGYIERLADFIPGGLTAVLKGTSCPGQGSGS